MADQKGFDLVMGSADQLLSKDIQMVFLGTGDPIPAKRSCEIWRCDIRLRSQSRSVLMNRWLIRSKGDRTLF
jgi:glycogen synthase